MNFAADLQRLWAPMTVNGMDSFTNVSDEGWTFLARDMRVWRDGSDERAWRMEPLPTHAWTGSWREVKIPAGIHWVYYRGRFDIRGTIQGDTLPSLEAATPSGFTPLEACFGDYEPPQRKRRHKSVEEWRRLDKQRTLTRVGLDPFFWVKAEQRVLSESLADGARLPPMRL